MNNINESILKSLNESKNNIWFRSFSPENFKIFANSLNYDIRKLFDHLVHDDYSEWTVMEDNHGEILAISNTNRDMDYNDVEIRKLIPICDDYDELMLKSILGENNISIFWFKCNDRSKISKYKNPEFKLKEFINGNEHFFFRNRNLSKEDLKNFISEKFW